MSDSLNDYFKDHLVDIAYLSMGMRFVAPEMNTNNSLDGLKFCITGSFSRSRDELKAELERRGAKFVSSVSKNLDVLFCGEKAGSKLTKAQQLGVRVADEEELMNLIEK
jgi:DNA ligase (NAD+)